MSVFLRQALRVLAKDLRVEWRSREILYTMTLFSTLLVVVFAFAFASGDGQQAELGAGLLWISVVFSGTLGLSRFFAREQEQDAIAALLLSPCSRGALYVGKLTATLCFMLLCEAVIVLLLGVLLDQRPAHPGLFVALLLLGTLGFAVVGALFAAPLMRLRAREVLLGILTYPIATPVIVAATKGTAALLVAPAEPAVALMWIKLLAGFDVAFFVVALLVFEGLATAE